MQSKTSFFNFSIFKKTVTRFWPIWFIYAFVWILVLPVYLGSGYSNVFGGSRDEIYFAQNVLYFTSAYPLRSISFGIIISLITGCISAMAVFSHMYFPRSCGAYASLPISRGAMFNSLTLAGIVPLLCVNALVFITTFIVELACGPANLMVLFQWFLAISMLNIFFYGFGVFCAQLTGNIIIMPFVYVILSFVAVLLEFLIQNIQSIFVFGYTAGNFALTALSPFVRLSRNLGVNPEGYYLESGEFINTNYVLNGMGLICIYALVGLVFIGLAVLLYKRRRMETAGDVVAVNVLKPVFKYCMTAGCALLFGLLIFSIAFRNSQSSSTLGHALCFCLFMLIGAAIGYFVAEMLLQKSFMVFGKRRHYIGIGVSFAVLSALLMASELDLTGFEKRVPEPSEVKAVTLNYDASFELKDPENIAAVIALHSDIISHKAIHESTQDNLGVRIEYELNDGSRISRRYDIDCTSLGVPDDWLEYQDILNSEEAILARKSLAFPITSENIYYAYAEYQVPTGDDAYDSLSIDMTPEEANEFYYECVLPDLEEGKLGRVWLLADDDYLDTVYSCVIRIECTERGTPGIGGSYDRYQSFYTHPTVYSTRVNEWLEERGVELHTVRECGGQSYMYDVVDAERTSLVVID